VGAGGRRFRPRGLGTSGRGVSGRGASGLRGSGLRIKALGTSRTAGSNWYTASPSGAWLRRGRRPWRKRSQRLLRMVGVGR
jgi:hypothetical protein